MYLNSFWSSTHGFQAFHLPEYLNLTSIFLVVVKKKLFVYLFILFLAVLGLHCCSSFPLTTASRGYSSRGAGAADCGGFSRCGAWALGCMGSVAACSQAPGTGSIVVAHRLWDFAPQHVGFSQIRHWTHVSCISWQILYHWATREALMYILTRASTYNCLSFICCWS